MTSANTSDRVYSVRELQAAAAALAQGDFAPRPPSSSADAAAIDTSQVDRGHDGPRRGPQHSAGLVAATAPKESPATSRVIRVWSAASGAGASTISLALADAADQDGTPTRLVDAAAPRWSSLLTATSTELGEHEGWRRGRRGHRLIVDRVSATAETDTDGDWQGLDVEQHRVDSVPVPAPADAQLHIIDTGWSIRELTATPNWIVGHQADIDVFVTRSDLHALNQTGAALARLARADATMIVVVVGATRSTTRTVHTVAGELGRALARAAVVLVPLTSHRHAVDDGPLPKNVMAGARQVLAHLPGP